MNHLRPAYRRLRRAVLARRRLLAALAAAAAVTTGLQAAAQPPPPRTLVVTAARDLPAGTVLRAGDLRRVPFASGSVPAGVLAKTRAVVGRTTAGPLRSGEPVTDVRLVSGGLLTGYPGLVAVPVRIGDPGAVALLRVGDRVDVLAADPQGAAEAEVVAAGAPVLALPRRPTTDPGMVSGGLLVLGVPEATARVLAAAGVAKYLSVVISGPP